MKKSHRRVSLRSNTIRTLNPEQQYQVNGGAIKLTLNGTGPNCPSDAGGCESGSWSCAGVSCC